MQRKSLWRAAGEAEGQHRHEALRCLRRFITAWHAERLTSLLPRCRCIRAAMQKGVVHVRMKAFAGKASVEGGSWGWA